MKKLTTLVLAALLSIAALAQDADKLYKEGKALYDKEKYTEAIAKLRPAAEQGHKKAQYRMGRIYSKGYGVAKDHAKASEWYAKAAAQGHAKAQYRLAKNYYKAKGVKEDKAKAKELLLKAISDQDHGSEILSDLKKDAKSGDDDAKGMLKLIGK